VRKRQLHCDNNELVELSILRYKRSVEAVEGSVNRSVCRVMVGVAGMAVLGMTATLGGAQTSVQRRVEHQHKRWRSPALAGG
jgi:hypothetical protein